MYFFNIRLQLPQMYNLGLQFDTNNRHCAALSISITSILCTLTEQRTARLYMSYLYTVKIAFLFRICVFYK